MNGEIDRTAESKFPNMQEHKRHGSFAPVPPKSEGSTSTVEYVTWLSSSPFHPL